MTDLSIITLTKDPSIRFLDLARDLSSQTSFEFKWIIVDSFDSNQIRNLLSPFRDLQEIVSLYTQPSGRPGLYAALNFAVEKCDTPFYLVIGDDDRLFPFSVSIINKLLRAFPSADFLSFNVCSNGDLVKPLFNQPYFYAGPRKYFSSHSVGIVVRSSLHKLNGCYSERYFIAGDENFLHRSILNGAYIKHFSLPLGVFGVSGISSKKIGLMLRESWHAKKDLGFLVTLLFACRYLKYILFR